MAGIRGGKTPSFQWNKCYIHRSLSELKCFKDKDRIKQESHIRWYTEGFLLDLCIILGECMWNRLKYKPKKSHNLETRVMILNAVHQYTRCLPIWVSWILVNLKKVHMFITKTRYGRSAPVSVINITYYRCMHKTLNDTQFNTSLW